MERIGHSVLVLRMMINSERIMMPSTVNQASSTKGYESRPSITPPPPRSVSRQRSVPEVVIGAVEDAEVTTPGPRSMASEEMILHRSPNEGVFQDEAPARGPPEWAGDSFLKDECWICVFLCVSKGWFGEIDARRGPLRYVRHEHRQRMMEEGFRTVHYLV